MQRMTVEPGLPFDAISIADTKPGPNAVWPLAYCLASCLISVSYDYSNDSFSLNPTRVSTIDCLLLSLSPRILTVGVLLSPRTVT